MLLFYFFIKSQEVRNVRGLFIRPITNFFALKISSYFTRENFDWHEIYLYEIYLLYERAIPSIELNVLDFYAVCFRDDWVFMESYLNGDAVVLTAFL